MLFGSKVIKSWSATHTAAHAAMSLLEDGCMWD